MTSPVQSTLERRLGPLDGAAIIVSNVIGGTIFSAAIALAGLVPDPWLYLGLWLAGGTAFAFAGAMAYTSLLRCGPGPVANTCILTPPMDALAGI